MSPKNKLKNLIGGIILVGTVLFLVYVNSPRGMVLVTEGIVPVYATEQDAMTSPPPAVVTTLSNGQSVPVMKCVDVKSYFLHQVQLPDGRIGFVNEGKYTLMRNGKQAFCS